MCCDDQSFHCPRSPFRLVLQPSLFGLFVGNPAKRLPLLLADAADAEARLLEHLHALEGPAGLAQLAQLAQRDGHGELGAELDVDEAPAGFLARGRGVVVWCAWSAGALWCAGVSE